MQNLHTKESDRQPKSNIALDKRGLRNPSTPPDPRHFSLPETRYASHVKHPMEAEIRGSDIKLCHQPAKTEGGQSQQVSHDSTSTPHRLVEIHHIKQRDGESTKDFMERYKAEVLDVEGAPECMRISGFMHGITHPGLIKRLYERIPRSMDEMYDKDYIFLQVEVAAPHSRPKKNSLSYMENLSSGGTSRISRKAQPQTKTRYREAIDSPITAKPPKRNCCSGKRKVQSPPPMVTQLMEKMRSY
ncbi:hypothetical protein Tco_0313405 [Tanacetum coccineum]